ncbi:MAG: Jag N-terminal domain-containing protein, partial [Bacillota bacterium]|nr:Jag N-terminal domain-containing protein [Bacillota bacterium]
MAKVKVEGPNLEQALANAARQLNAGVEEVQYNILQEKKALLGLMRSVELEAWVRTDVNDINVTPDKAGQILIDENQKMDANNGTISITNGKISVTEPKEGGMRAVLVPTDKFIVEVNGQQIIHPTEVNAGDEIKVETIVVEPRQELKIELTKDQMTATGKLELVMGQRYELVDSKPAQHVTLAGKLIELKPAQLTREEILAKLTEAKVGFGIEDAAVNTLVKARESTTVTLAEGRRGNPPVNET